ncbi:MAG: response regulator [Methylomonas sp.]|jgi:CheY-like chemotaxis protein
MKFLIVDDSRAVQTIIKRALEQAGIKDAEFKTAMNGEQAMAVIPDWRPDLVITDWHMPTMTGIELLKLIRQSDFSHTKVGFVTTETAPRYLDEALNNGACFVINKPCSDIELQDAVFSVFPLARPHASAPEADPVHAKTGLFAINPASVLLDFFQKELETTLTLTPVLRRPVTEIVGPMVVSAYRLQEGKKMVGICLLDKNAAILTGGRLSGMSTKEIATFIKADGLDKEFSDHAIELLSKSAPALFSTAKDRPLPIEMGASNVVSRLSEKLCNVIEDCASRFDYIISSPEFGSGLVLIVCY